MSRAVARGLAAFLAVSLVVGVVSALVGRTDDDAEVRGDGAIELPPTSEPGIGQGTATTATTTTTAPATAPRGAIEEWSDAAGVGRPYGDVVRGLLTFRGNPTRTYYGTGPVSREAPVELWRHPRAGGMCATSSDHRGARVWCGTGWTGQPAVFERAGRTWVVFGAYDRGVHFLDADTGQPILPSLYTGDIIKGSVTVDPDGYPIVYTGSRDDYYRAIAIDRDVPVELWRLWAHDVSPTLWNNDWDGAGLIIDDHLFIGGENSQFHIVELNRGYGPDGKVTVDPQLVFNAPGWDDELLAAIRDREVSIESSVSIFGDTVYFANSGGLVQGWDVSGLAEGRSPERVFRFWTGDDTDATIVIDEGGFLYVASEYERGLARAREVGQIMKLDPSSADDPLVWSVHDHDRIPAGAWATPALHRDLLIATLHSGAVLGIDRETGEVRWRLQVQSPSWSSPVVVDDLLVQGDCAGILRAFDVSDTTVVPPLVWSYEIGGCIESTPAVWDGRIYVGTRAGAFHALGRP